MIDPPTIDIMTNDDANLELSPKSLQDKAKMVGNMMDWKKYTIINAITAQSPPPNMQIHKESTAPIA